MADWYFTQASGGGYDLPNGDQRLPADPYQRDAVGKLTGLVGQTITELPVRRGGASCERARPF